MHFASIKLKVLEFRLIDKTTSFCKLKSLDKLNALPIWTLSALNCGYNYLKYIVKICMLDVRKRR